MPPGPGHGKCTAYPWPGPGGAPLALPLTEGLGVRLRALRLNLRGQLLNRNVSDKSLALRGVVAAARTKLPKETNSINDAKFTHECVSCSLGYSRDRIKVCTHWEISEIRPRIEMGVTVRLESDLARRSNLSSAVTK